MFRDEPYSRVFHGLSRIPGISRHVTMPYSMVNFQLKGSVIKPLSVNKISEICCVALQLQLCPINQMKQVLLRNIPVTWKEADNILRTMCDGKSSFTTFHFGVTKRFQAWKNSCYLKMAWHSHCYNGLQSRTKYLEQNGIIQ